MGVADDFGAAPKTRRFKESLTLEVSELRLEK
jgi:hypothetical protein